MQFLMVLVLEQDIAAKPLVQFTARNGCRGVHETMRRCDKGGEVCQLAGRRIR